MGLSDFNDTEVLVQVDKGVYYHKPQEGWVFRGA